MYFHIPLSDLTACHQLMRKRHGAIGNADFGFLAKSRELFSTGKNG
jgi:hypothetical protein